MLPRKVIWCGLNTELCIRWFLKLGTWVMGQGAVKVAGISQCRQLAVVVDRFIIFKFSSIYKHTNVLTNWRNLKSTSWVPLAQGFLFCFLLVWREQNRSEEVHQVLKCYLYSFLCYVLLKKMYLLTASFIGLLIVRLFARPNQVHIHI